MQHTTTENQMHELAAALDRRHPAAAAHVRAAVAYLHTNDDELADRMTAAYDACSDRQLREQIQDTAEGARHSATFAGRLQAARAGVQHLIDATGNDSGDDWSAAAVTAGYYIEAQIEAIENATDPAEHRAHSLAADYALDALQRLADDIEADYNPAHVRTALDALSAIRGEEYDHVYPHQRAMRLMQRLQASARHIAPQWSDEGPAGELHWLMETAENLIYAISTGTPHTTITRDLYIGSCCPCEYYRAEHNEMNAIAEQAGLL